MLSAWRLDPMAGVSNWAIHPRNTFLLLKTPDPAPWRTSAFLFPSWPTVSCLSLLFMLFFLICYIQSCRPWVSRSSIPSTCQTRDFPFFLVWESACVDYLVTLSPAFNPSLLSPLPLSKPPPLNPLSSIIPSLWQMTWIPAVCSKFSPSGGTFLSKPQTHPHLPVSEDDVSGFCSRAKSALDPIPVDFSWTWFIHCFSLSLLNFKFLTTSFNKFVPL